MKGIRLKGIRLKFRTRSRPPPRSEAIYSRTRTIEKTKMMKDMPLLPQFDHGCGVNFYRPRTRPRTRPRSEAIP